MSDSFTHVSHQSWGSRLGNSIKGILFGLFLFIIAFPLLFWNEGRAIETEKSLKEGAAAVIKVSSERIDPANEGKLVYLSGLANTKEELHDRLFNVTAQAIRLSRKVSVYQWKEHSESKTEKELGGSTKTTTTYTYSKEWSPILTASSSFKHPEGHQNPSMKRYKDQTIYAKNVSLGQFKLSSAQIQDISGGQSITLSEKNIPKNVQASIVSGEIYIGDPNQETIGDLRISFYETKPSTISLVAAQVGNSFAAYQTEAGKPIQLLTMGVVTAKEMFANELANNRLLTWGLRFLGFIIMMMGLSMIMKPLIVFADVVPFIGNLLGIGTSLISAVIAFVFSLLTIAFAWVFYRPLVALGLVALIVGPLVYLKRKAKTNTSNTQEAPQNKPVNIPSSSAPPPPPPTI